MFWNKKQEVTDQELSELRQQAYANDLDISQLSESDIASVQSSLHQAAEEEHGSGAHWLLMAQLSRLGFKTKNPNEASQVAERIIIKWNRNSK